jgi:hypothetical protein
MHATPCRSDYDGECGYTDYGRQIPSRLLCNRITTVVYVPSYLYELSSVSRKLVSVPAGGSLHPEETKPLTAKAKVYRQRDRIRVALAPDILAFDPSVEAERLWRHAPASGRAMARARLILQTTSWWPVVRFKGRDRGDQAIDRAERSQRRSTIATNEPKLSGHWVRGERCQNEASSRTDRKSQVASGK